MLEHGSENTAHGTKSTVDHVNNSEVTMTHLSEDRHNDLCKCNSDSHGHNNGWILVCNKRKSRSHDKRHFTNKQFVNNK